MSAILDKILDTSFLLATVNRKDKNHNLVLDIIVNLKEPLILPMTVLPEVSYLIASRLGHHIMRQFLADLVVSNMMIEVITKEDLQRTTEILTQYSDSQLDFVDATITAIAERMNITKVLTLDRRDFSIIRPKHCHYFQIFP
ncbi:PIN domain-containing protein [Anabaena sp. FACHB-1237]|uniref:type II toxin-antitoxin system VapC family toxin n=1 Tax=Anabaena sp. FACHB-1237 TaxID=2692769 RepID=UPI00167FF560|nr:PIN domain-containing protein [Anabaena sp. FACHB-1237]MBD2138129.1 PIN domain-containing protein [Anabaena sp. FACHB-1237]